MDTDGIRVDYFYNHKDCTEKFGRISYGEWTPVFESLGMSVDDVIESYRDRARIGSIPLGLVALDGEKYVGMASLKKSDLEIREELTPWMASLYVEPEYRGRGIATMLMERLIEEAKRLGFGEVYLWTANAEPLYTKHGWERIEQTDYCGEQIAIMRRST